MVVGTGPIWTCPCSTSATGSCTSDYTAGFYCVGRRTTSPLPARTATSQAVRLAVFAVVLGPSGIDPGVISVVQLPVDDGDPLCTSRYAAATVATALVCRPSGINVADALGRPMPRMGAGTKRRDLDFRVTKVLVRVARFIEKRVCRNRRA